MRIKSGRPSISQDISTLIAGSLCATINYGGNTATLDTLQYLQDDELLQPFVAKIVEMRDSIQPHSKLEPIDVEALRLRLTSLINVVRGMESFDLLPEGIQQWKPDPSSEATDKACMSVLVQDSAFVCRVLEVILKSAAFEETGLGYVTEQQFAELDNLSKLIVDTGDAFIRNRLQLQVKLAKNKGGNKELLRAPAFRSLESYLDISKYASISDVPSERELKDYTRTLISLLPNGPEIVRKISNLRKYHRVLSLSHGVPLYSVLRDEQDSHGTAEKLIGGIHGFERQAVKQVTPGKEYTSAERLQRVTDNCIAHSTYNTIAAGEGSELSVIQISLPVVRSIVTDVNGFCSELVDAILSTTWAHTGYDKAAPSRVDTCDSGPGLVKTDDGKILIDTVEAGAVTSME